MLAGEEGLRGLKAPVSLFSSKDHVTALRRALEIGRSHSGRASSRTKVGRNQADIVTLDNLGSNPIEFEVNLGTKKPVLGTKKPVEHLPFEHVFDPEGVTPPTMF